jgi:hypothetical protein
MEEINNQPKEPEGLWLKINDRPRTKEEVYSHQGMPGGKSYAERLTSEHGPEGIGWRFVTDAYATENEFEETDTKIHHDIAREALRNSGPNKEPVTKDGVLVSRRQLDDYTRTQKPPLGDIEVYYMHYGGDGK